MFDRRHFLSALSAFLFGAALIGAAIIALAGTTKDEKSTMPGKQGYMTASLLEELIASSDEEAFERPTGSWELTLPDDQGALNPAGIHCFLK